jgi:hypothetical protein
MISVQEINDEAEFFHLRESWNTLLSKSSFGSPFLRWEWLVNWLRFFGANCQLSILLMKDGESLVGVAPLVVQSLGFGSLSINQMQLLGASSVGSDYLDIICENGKEMLVSRAVFKYLQAHRYRWDAIQLTHIPENSTSVNSLVESFKDHGFFVHRSFSSSSPLIELPESWQTYFSNLSKSTRSGTKRKVNKLQKNFEVEYEVISEKRKAEMALPDLIRLNRSRMGWQEDTGWGFSQ